MAVFKATQNKKGSLDSGKFKATNRKSYDSIMVYDWETKNKESISTLNNYYTKINNGEFLTADDITAYQTALNDYVNSSKSLRGINKSFGGTYSEEEEKKWNDSITLMQTDYDNASKFYSSFKNEDKYKDYLAGVQRQTELKNYDLTAGATEIAELESIYNSTKNQLDSLNHELVRAIDNRDVNKVKSIRTQIEEAENKLEQYGDIESILAEKRAYYGEAERLQNGIKLTEEAKNDADFATYSQQGASIKNPTLDEAWGGFSIGSWRPFGEEVGNIVTFSRQYSDEEMAKYGDSNNSPLLTNPLYGFMTDDEVSIYNYYLAKEGKEKASEYLSAIEGDLTARQATGIVDNIGDNGLLKVVFNVAANVENYFVGMKNLITEEDYYAPTASQLASNELSGTFDTVFGQVMYDLAGSIGYMLPSILVGNVLGGAIGTASMGLSAMGNAKAEMINLGYTKEQANTYGFLVGASEAGLQYILGGISSLGGKGADNLSKTVLSKIDNAFANVSIKHGKNILYALSRIGAKTAINMGSEALEESMQTMLEPWFKSIVTGVDFEAPDAGEVLYSGLLGALSAGLLEGAGNIGGEVSTYKSGQLVQNAGAVDRLAKLGSTFAADSVAYKIAGKVNENTGAYTIGRLLNEVGATLTEQNKSEIRKSLQRKMLDKDIETHIKWLNEVVEGAELTDEQALILDSNEIVSKVFHDVIINENSTVNQRIKAYSEAIDMVNKELAKKEALKTKSLNGSKTVETTNTEIPSTQSETKEEGKKADLSEVKTTYEGNEVSIKEVASIKDGEVFVRLNDGREVNTKEVDFNRKEDGLIYEHVANMNSQTAQYFIDGFNKGNIGGGETISFEQYMRGFDEAYKIGSLGIPYYSISKDGFAATLSETQRKIAYNRGRIDSVAKIEAQQKEVDAKKATVSKTETVEKKKGKVYFEKGVHAKNDRQKASIKALQVVADALGINIHIFESAVDATGKRSGKNGWYNPSDNSIHIDLYAGADGKSTILFTAAHELTHFIREWSPQKFKTFADFLLAQYGARGVSVEQLVQSQIDKAKRNGRDIDYDTAYEEVIADACEAMLTDSNAIKKLAMLKAKDRGLVSKIKTFINNLVEKIKKAYAKLAPDSVEAKLVRGMVDVAEQLQTLWTDALMDAGEAYQTIDTTLSNNGVMVDPKTESASLLSVRDVLDSKQQDQVAKALAERFGVTDEEAKNWISAETSLASIILNPKYSQYLDYTADPNEQAIKKNSDYPQGTVDFSNICKKRRDFTDVMNRVLRKFPNHVFEATDLAKIRTIMMEEGMEVACGICYVEDRRQLDSIVAQDFINSLALYREGSKTRPDGAPFNTNQLKALQLIDGDTYTPTIYELVSLEGRNSLKAKNPAMEEAWVKFNNARGMQSVRLLLNDAEYKRQILKYSPTVVNRKNDYGGLRIYSFSDMEMFHLIDIIQVITDSATVGLSIQGYTKVNEYAKAVKDTGEKLNRSLIPKGDLGYHIENGKVVLDYDTVEGIDINHPDFFDSTDNPNVGNIVIGINETQIKASMLSDFIDYIIPFHTGQSNEVLGEKGIAEWHNYVDSQSEIDLATGKKSSHQINIYTEVLQAAEKEGKPITNKVEFVNKFLEVCKENGLRPRFSEFLNIGKDGEYVYTEGYHKFLVDFKMFDTKTGEYLPQKPVKPIFDNEYLMSLLKDYVKSQQEKDAKLAETIPTVLDRITNEIVKPDVKYSDSNPDIRYSDRVTDKETLEFLENQEHVTVYRAMQLIDGKLYPPMNAYTYDENGKKVLMPPSEIGAWEQAVERPDLIDPKTGKFKLDKGKTDSGKKGTTVAAAYNPYIHTSLSMLNDQFTSAYTRSNLVVVKGVVPKSELSSGYRAEYAKDSVGETEWHSGVVSSQLPESRKVILSRWFKPVEVMDNDAVAQSIKKLLGNTGIEIPYNVVSPNLRRSLEKIGVPVGEGRGIRNLPNKNEVKYSDRDPDLAEQREKVNKVLESENAKLREDNQYLKELVKLQRKQTHGAKFTKSSVQIVASKLMKSVNANGNRAELVQLLNNFYEHIANGENLAWEEIAETAQPAVNWLKNHVANKKTKLDPHAREILDNLRSKRIYLNKEQQSEAAYVYGSFYEYRKKAMGSLMIVNKDNPNGAIALESVWYELAELYPDYFDSEITVAEMPARLLDIIDALRNFHDYSTDYEYAEDMLEQELLLQVYDGYWDVSTLHTAADSYQKQINLLKLKHHQKIAELRDYHNEKHNQLKKDYQEKITRIKSEYRERNAKTTRELMNRYQESRAKATEGRHKTEMKHKIQKVVKELKKLLLSPTKDKHVKEELQRAVAEALWSINMDTVGADERVAKYNDLIAKASDPDVIQELTDTRDRIQFQGENLKDKLDALKSAYEKIKNSKDAELSNAYQEVVLNSISNTLELVGDTPIRYMSLEQLEAVYEMYSMVLHTVRTANKMFKESKYETLVQTAEAVNSEVRLAGGEHYKRTAIGSTLNKIGWTFLKPFTAFRTIGSKTLTSLYNNLRSGEDTYYVDIKEAQAFIEEQYKKHNFSKWDMKQTKEFTAKSGKTFSLTLEQMMSIFAYSRREQAKAHLLEGGIVLDDAVQVVEKNKLGLPVKYEVTTKSAFNLSEGTLLEIIDSLTDEQKAFVKEMQSYLSDTMGAKGNEISMEMYGIKLFKEAFYFPIKSSSDYMGFKPEEAGEIKLKNPSFSKETVRHANNPVVLSNFTDVWANHVNDMSMYHSFVLPLEDFTRVFNYKTRTDAMTETMSTEATIANAYGKGATQYIRNFLKSLNGGVRVQGTPADKLISLTKKGAVLASASVTIQQPSAVMRAMAYIKPKYFVKATADSLKLVNHKKDWAEIKQYAPIAGIKEMGHFDIGLGQSTVDWIKSNKTTMEKVDDVLSAAPAYMDELTWVSIWQAVKREVLDTTDLKFGTKAYLEKVGERFTEVVSLSQVYDSVFARSDLMRNPNPLAKMLTSFMAEPSTTLNMLFDSWVQAKRTGSKKPMTITSGAVVSSIVLNAMLKSIVIAMRDDDEDESYTEKYFEAFFGDLKDSLNPLTLIPLVKDVVSIFNGYDVERMDMALFSDLKNAIDAFDSESKTAYEKWSGLIGALSAFFGVPIKNVERDIRGFINTMESFFNGEKTTGAGIWNAIREGLSGKESSKTQQLYEAYLNGDQGQIKRVEGRFKDEADIEAALRKALRENDPRIREAAQAVIDGNHAERIRITKEIKAEGHFKQDTIVAAINAELTAMRRENKE